MIRDKDLFGRDAISPNEKLIVKAAIITAKELFNSRYDESLINNWDVDVEKLTLEDVERDVVKSILQKYDLKNEGIVHATQFI